MSHPFTHPTGRELLRRVAQQFSGADTYILRDSNIVFVCGGTGDGYMRPRFCEYARNEIPHLRIFLAEDAQKDYVTHSEPEFHNVGEFEDIIGEVSDCVVLFPESPGSFAEVVSDSWWKFGFDAAPDLDGHTIMRRGQSAAGWAHAR